MSTLRVYYYVRTKAGKSIGGPYVTLAVLAKGSCAPRSVRRRRPSSWRHASSVGNR